MRSRRSGAALRDSRNRRLNPIQRTDHFVEVEEVADHDFDSQRSKAIDLRPFAMSEYPTEIPFFTKVSIATYPDLPVAPVTNFLAFSFVKLLVSRIWFKPRCADNSGER